MSRCRGGRRWFLELGICFNLFNQSFMRVLFLTIVFLFLSKSAYLQSSIYAPVHDVFQNNPKAPNVSSLYAFKEIPVNASSGIPNISIPIYTIEAGGLKLPISLKYHGGGLRVDELPTTIGLGWSLQVGGVISQKVNGLDDFLGTEGDLYDVGTYISPSYGNVSVIQSQTINSMTDYFSFINNAIATGDNYKITESKRFLGRVADGWFDAEADEFFFSTPTGSGTIFYDQANHVFKNSNVDNWEIVETPLSGFNQGRWVLLDPNGFVYTFEKKEISQSPLVNNISARPCRVPENCDRGVIPVRYPQLINTWHLSSVTNAKTNSIFNLSYLTQWKHYTTGYSFRDEFNTAGTFVGGGLAEINSRDGDECLINEITFPKGKVKFIYSSTLPNEWGPSALEYIRVYDKNNIEVIGYKLEYEVINPVNNSGSVDATSHILFLKRILQLTGIGNNQQLYELSYNFQTRFPKRFLFAQDEWGYYNGKDNNSSLISRSALIAYNVSVQNANVYGGDRSVDANYTQSGILTQLKYPTGGVTNFEYEQNSIQGQFYGGCRVKSVTNNSLIAGQATKIDYTYDEQTAFGYKPILRYGYQKQMPEGGYGINVFTGGASMPGINNQGSCMVYGSVTQDRRSADNSYGIRVKQYYHLPAEAPSSMSGVPFPKLSNLNEKRLTGEAYRTEQYIYNHATQTYSLQSSSESSIEPVNGLSDFNENVQSAWTHPNLLYGDYIVWPGNDPYSWNAYPAMNVSVGENVYRLYRDSYLPFVKDNKIYSSTGVIQDLENYEYDTQNGNLKKVIKTNSQGDIMETRVKYRKDYLLFNNLSNPWDVMLSSLLGGLPVEVSEYIMRAGTTEFVLSKSTLYKYQNSNLKSVYVCELNMPVNDFVESSNTSSQFVFDSRYSLIYDVTTFDERYNPLTLKDRANVISYIYDSEFEDVIAKVDNAVSTDVAFTSFETGSYGNWQVVGGGVNQALSFTGISSYLLSAGSMINRPGISLGNYIVSYWSRSGSMLVNGVSGISGVSKNGWTYYEHFISGVNSISVSGSGTIDELRLYPQGARMTTFCYKPLVGIINQCDVNNRVSKYIYDDFNRLNIIYDLDGNIIKKICYNYAGQVENCASPTVYFNSVQSQTFTRNNCGACSQGSQVTYTVPANTYSSTVSLAAANQLALNDIAQNGQAYANANGTCGTAMLPLTYNNQLYGTSGTGFTAVYSTKAPGPSYTFNIPGYGSGSLGCIPAGLYTLTISKSGNSLQILFNSGCAVQSGTSAVFGKVDPATCSQVTLQLDAQ